MGFAQHRGVIVGISGCDHLEVELLEATHRLTLLIRHAQMVIHEAAGVVGFQAVAEQGRPAELPHQRVGELVEGVGQDHHLVVLAQRVEETARTVHRPHRGDDLLDLRQAQAVLGKDAEAVLHQRVVVRLVTGGTTERRDTGAFGEFDPDFGNEDTFEIETDDFHGTGLSVVGKKQRAIVAPRLYGFQDGLCIVISMAQAPKA
jgi:hypothetical protein